MNKDNYTIRDKIHYYINVRKGKNPNTQGIKSKLYYVKISLFIYSDTASENHHSSDMDPETWWGIM